MFSCCNRFYEETAPSHQNLPRLPKTIFLEKEMGKKLGIS